MEEKHYFDTNKQLWDNKTPIHLKSDFYDLSGFKSGKSSLRKIELSELPDVKGKKILHAQCHFGQDTLSLERMGAHCTGVDLSPVSIEAARALAIEMQLDSKFILSNIYDLDRNCYEQFDMIYTSYGVITWLPDLDRWAQQLTARLAPGGLFYMAEFHPVIYMWEWEENKIKYNYFNHGKPYAYQEEGTYADTNADISMKEYFWMHSLAAVMKALMDNGITITSFAEYDYSPYNIFPGNNKRAEQEYIFSPDKVSLPHVFTIQGIKN